MIDVAAAGALGSDRADGLVVGIGPGLAPDPGAAWVLDGLGPAIRDHLAALDFDGKAGQVAVVPGPPDSGYRSVVFAGLGDDPDPEALRRAAGAAGRASRRLGTVATTLHLTGGAGAAGAVAQGFALGQYSFQRHLSEPDPARTEALLLVGGSEDDLEEARRALIVARGVILARDLVNESPAHKSPDALAATAVEMGERAGVRVRVHGEDEIAEAGLGGLMGVAAGAASPPRLVELWYEPGDARAFVAFVGKGIVFDSGGLALKSVAAMESMKTDMSGAAAVIGAVEAIARLGLPVRVLGIVPLAENMPDGGALRPGDVIRARNGKTIEVVNTDAEGRLILADGLSLAVEAGPDLIIDIATLTGACVVALGEKIAGVMGTEDAVATVTAAADAAGERVWRLPIPPDYRSNLDSDVADMKNTAGRRGGALHAAVFLQEFAGTGPWAHLDIAGPARAAEAEHYLTKGGTGFGVRTLVAVAERLSTT